MTREENIKAILECNFSGFKDEIIDVAVNAILNLASEQEPKRGAGMKTCNDCIHKSICYWAKSPLSSNADKCEDFKAEKTGHWVAIDEEPHEDYECDNCGYTISTYTANIEPLTEYKYCPNCGAKMESEEQT